MKIQYLTEGIFKTPEQIKAAKAKNASISNAEKVAKESNKIIIEFLREKLAGYLDDVRKKEDYEWYKEKEMHSAMRFLRQSLITDLCANFEELCRRYSDGVDLSFIPEVRVEGDKLICDIYADNGQAIWYRTNDNEYHCKMYKTFSRYRLGESCIQFTERLKKCLELDAANAGEKEKSIYDFLLEKTIELGKIHLFNKVEGDIWIDLWYDENKSTPLHDFIRSTRCMAKIFSFENKGRCIVRFLGTNYRIEGDEKKVDKVVQPDNSMKNLFIDIIKDTWVKYKPSEHRGIQYGFYDKRRDEIVEKLYIPLMKDFDNIIKKHPEYMDDLAVYVNIIETKMELEVIGEKVEQLPKHCNIKHVMFIKKEYTTLPFVKAYNGKILSFYPKSGIVTKDKSPMHYYYYVDADMGRIVEFFLRDVDDYDKGLLAVQNLKSYQNTQSAVSSLSLEYRDDDPEYEKFENFMKNVTNKLVVKPIKNSSLTVIYNGKDEYPWNKFDIF